jgi:hypothetical protein
MFPYAHRRGDGETLTAFVLLRGKPSTPRDSTACAHGTLPVIDYTVRVISPGRVDSPLSMRACPAISLFLAAAIAYAGSAERAPGERIFALDALKQSCIEFAAVRVGPSDSDASDCRVSEFESLGIMGGRQYYYALYCLIPSYATKNGQCDSKSFNARYYRERALAIFVGEGAPGSARLWIERATADIGLFVYEKPAIVKNSIGTFLHVPIRVDGTGGGNESEYYLWDGGQWRLLETKSWLEDLKKRVPPENELWHGVWPNLANMTAKTGLYRHGDANCCPTGGAAEVTLTVENDRFVIRSLTIVPRR